MLAIRIPEELEQRLNELARSTKRSKSFYVREAIAAYLEDFEDLAAAESVLERIRTGREEVVSAEEFWRGLDDY